MWVSLVPFGVGACMPIYAGVRARVTRWTALGLVWVAIVAVAFVMNAVTKSGQHGNNDLAGFLFLASWIGGAVTSFAIRRSYERRMASPLQAARAAAAERIEERHQAIDLARSNPELAAEMGIGRPGRDGLGLIDVNDASVAGLRRLPGITDELATQIVETRAQTGGFSSLEDMGMSLDLDGDLVERLRGRTVFLPRSG